MLACKFSSLVKAEHLHSTQHCNWFTLSGDFSYQASCLEWLPIFLPISSLGFTPFVAYHDCLPKPVTWFQTTAVMSSLIILGCSDASVSECLMCSPHLQQLITSFQLLPLLMVLSLSYQSFTSINFCAYVLNFPMFKPSLEHFTSKNCLFFFVSSNVPTTVLSYCMCS